MKGKNIAHKILIPVILLMIVLFSVLTIWVLITPPVLTEEVPLQSIYRRINYDYRVYTVPSTLYPEGTIPLMPEVGSYYTTLTDRIIFTVSADAVEITNNDLDPQAVDFSIALFIRSPEQWEIKLDDFDPPISVTTPIDGTIEYALSFALPLARVQQLSEMIAEEIGVRPRDGVQLVIISNLVTHSEDGSSSNLTAEYLFTLKDKLIEANQELSFSDDKIIAYKTKTINHLSMFGAVMKVSMGRYLFPSFLVFSLLAGGYYLRDTRKNGPVSQDDLKLKRAKLKKRYSSRIIEVNELKGVVAQKTVLIVVKDMKELIRVADELERPVLEVIASEEFEESAAEYCVVGEEAIYSYKL